MSPIKSIHVGEKTTDPTPLTRPTDSPKQRIDSSDQKGKARLPADPDPDPSLLYSPLNNSNLLNDTNSSKSNKNKRDKKKNRHKHNKQYSSDSSPIDYD